MALASTHHELEYLGNRRYRHTQHMRRIAYLRDGSLRQIVSTWLDSGISERPHIVSESPLMATVGDDGLRRIHPTREIDRYLEIGTPWVKVAGVWTKVGFTGASRTGNAITWSRPQADLSITHGGHFAKLAIELKGGYVPQDNLIAFPVGINGLTRQGLSILRDGALVALLREPHVADASNPLDVRPIATQFTNLAGQPYLVLTLPSLTGMARPVVDPTVTIQPDATDGQDTHINNPTSDGNNYGVYTYNTMGYYGGNRTRILIKFNLSTVPDTFDTATVSLYLEGQNGSGTNTYRFFRQKRVWLEGDKAGTADSPASGATWNRYDTTNNWQTVGAFGANDCEQTDIGSLVLANALPLGFKNWLLTPTTKAALDLGNGWLAKADADGSNTKNFSSSDNATAANRPKLVVNYTVQSTRSFAVVIA